jgi:hypothetical protein
MKRTNRTASDAAVWLTEYEERSLAGAALAAITALGKALRCVPPGRREGIVAQIRTLTDPQVLANAAQEASAAHRQAARIVAIGSSFDEDELLLVLTLRVQIELVKDVLEIFSVDSVAMDLGGIDAELREIAGSRSNRAAFSRALASMRRNSGIAIDDIWTT